MYTISWHTALKRKSVGHVSKIQMYKYKQNNYTMQSPHKNFSYVHDDKLKSYNVVVIILLLYIHERHV